MQALKWPGESVKSYETAHDSGSPETLQHSNPKFTPQFPLEKLFKVHSLCYRL